MSTKVEKIEKINQLAALEQFTQIPSTAEAAFIYSNPDQAYRSALAFLGLSEGDYILLSALAHPLLVKIVEELGAHPIFFDVKSESGQMDLDLLENFLSLYSFINEENDLIYRKDQKVIRLIIAEHHFGPSENIGDLAFIANRYNLLLLEDFSFVFPLNEHPERKIGQAGNLALTQLVEVGAPENDTPILLFKNATVSLLGAQINKASLCSTESEAQVLSDQELVEQVELRLKQHKDFVQLKTELLSLLKNNPDWEIWKKDIATYLLLIFVKERDQFLNHLNQQGLSIAAFWPDRREELERSIFITTTKNAFKFLEEGFTFSYFALDQEKDNIIKAITSYKKS